MYRYKNVQEDQNDDNFVVGSPNFGKDLGLKNQVSPSRASSVAASGYDASSEYSTPTYGRSRTNSPTSSRGTTPESNTPIIPLSAPVPKHPMNNFLDVTIASLGELSGTETPYTAPTPQCRYPSECPLPTPSPELHHPRPIKTFSCEGYDDRNIPTPVFIPSSRPATDDES